MIDASLPLCRVPQPYHLISFVASLHGISEKKEKKTLQKPSTHYILKKAKTFTAVEKKSSVDKDTEGEEEGRTSITIEVDEHDTHLA